jgi:diguanylate cyclase (GGDEF)-like protein/PAS domain S-box-containing protein
MPRVAAVLFAGAGAVTLVSAVVGLTSRSGRLGASGVGLAAMLTGFVATRAPWDRWPVRAQLALVPLALILITLGNIVDPQPYEYAAFFVVVHVWVGMAQPRWTSVWLAPFTALAYWLPLMAESGSSAAFTVLAVVPLCVLVGETVAWLMDQADATEVLRREGEALQERERGARSDLHDLQLQLRLSERRLRVLVEQLPVITYVDAHDALGTTLFISPQVESLLGYPPSEWIEDPRLWRRLVHPDDRDSVLAEHETSRSEGRDFAMEYRLIARNGRSVWIRDEAVLVNDVDGSQEWQGLMTDVTERKQTKERLEFLAFHDAVTGLPNRAFFEQHLEIELARARRSGEALVVCALDLDKFKLVNDTLGHAAGDAFLREVASRLQATLRESDVLARAGGDEFLVLMPSLPAGTGTPQDAASAGAKALSTRLAEALDPPFVHSDMELRMSASIGTALFPRDAEDAHGLLKHADTTMYRSKRGRQADVSETVYVDVSDQMRGELSLASRLRRAAREGSWQLAYQPIVELVLGRTVGAESLLRWPDDGLGEIDPGRFIPMAEELGLISTLGGWVITELTERCRQWEAEGVLNQMTALSFNLSPRELWHPALMERLAALRDATGRNDLLVIEITESSLTMDPVRVKTILREIRDLGIRVALDDFGTGYSSLSRLQHLPIDVLKIDRTFVQDVAHDASARSIVRSMIRLTHSLGMVPLAEGIETVEQLGFITDHGCALAQGYLFGRAMPADVFTAGLGAVQSPIAQLM